MESVKTMPVARNRVWNVAFLLICLSFLDALFTDLGLRFGYIEEANPLMKYIYVKSNVIFYALKLGLPLFLLYLVTLNRLPVYIKTAISIVFFLYTAVVSLHFLWIFTAIMY